MVDLLSSDATVASKLAPPVLDQALVARAALIDRLSASDLALVVAPAGYGKTVVADQWYRACSPGTAAWLSVDLLDSRPAVFWSHLIAALRSTDASIDGEPAALLRERGPDDPLFLVSLCSQLLAYDGQLSVVLDDLDRIDDPRVMPGLEALVERTMGSVRVLATGRTEPALPFPRWRAAGRVSEIRREDLRFDDVEAKALVASFGASLLTDREVRSVNERVEGWPAGLQLAMLVVSAAESPSEAARHVTGSDDLIAGYFTSEVLPALTDRQRSVALAMSVPQWFDIELCRAIAGDDSVPAIRELWERGLFLSTLDRPDSYRFHALFRQLLEEQLRWSDPALHEKLHRRTADVLLDRGDHLAAYHHLLAVGDVEAAVKAATAPALALVDSGRAVEMASLLDALPEDLEAHSADEAIDLGVAHIMTSKRAGAARWFERAAPMVLAEDDVGQLRLAFGRMVVAMAIGDDETSARELARCDELRARVDDAWGFGGRFEGTAARFAVVAERPDADQRVALLRTVDAASPMTEVVAPAIESVQLAAGGDLTGASRLAEAALARAEELELGEHPAMIDALLAAGSTALGRGELRRAADLVERVRDMAIPLLTWYEVRVGALYAEIIRLLEGGPAALAVVDELRSRADQPVRDGSIGRLLDRAWAGALIACGRIEAAHRVLDVLPDSPVDNLLRGRALVIAGDHGALEPLLATRADWPAQHRIEADVLMAIAASGQQAELAMRGALELGARTTWIAPLLGHGHECDRVLGRLPLHELYPDLDRLLSADTTDRAQVGPQLEPLTDREQELLALLPTHFSNAQIGQQVHVSVNTVKTHLKALYRKLHVSSRAEAVEVAHRAGLLARQPDGRTGEPARSP